MLFAFIIFSFIPVLFCLQLIVVSPIINAKITIFFILFICVLWCLLQCPLTPGGFAKCFAFCKTFRCTKSLKGLRTAKPPGDVTEARRDFVTSVWGFAKWRKIEAESFGLDDT